MEAVEPLSKGITSVKHELGHNYCETKWQNGDNCSAVNDLRLRLRADRQRGKAPCNEPLQTKISMEFLN